MKCPRCQHENRHGAKFCEECATPLARTCSNCGSQLSATAKFCPECAHPVAGATPPETRFTSPESYTPQHLAEKILTSKAALEGERKQVTVLFADLKGSMELLADRDPEEARKILDPVLERMMEAVHRYEGTVNQVMGDGIMALFGAPLAHEDHAVRACYAALRMQESVNRYAEEARRAYGVDVQIRVGLNSGEVVVRTIGGDLRMDYTAVGETTHLAARMEQLARPGSVFLTPAVLNLVEGFVDVKSLGPVPVKGLPAPVEVYELSGIGAARTRLQAAARRGLTRFVGRDSEIELLRRSLGLAGAGRGQLVAIVGEAGVGKSRLVYEFTHSHRIHDWLVLEATSVSYGKATNYLAVIDLLRGYFKIQDRDDLREVREKVTGKVLALDESLRSALSPLLSLLDVPVGDPDWPALDPGQRRQRTLEAVKRLLLREAQEQPVLVIFEDLHWIDGETQAVLDSLVESLGSVRMLLLVNYRPEYQHAWGSRTFYEQVRLDALPPERAADLLDALLGDDASVVPVKKLLVRRGNPFFLEESVRTLVETGALLGERGRFRLVHAVDTLQIPATVQAILTARIDRLLAEDKRLLQVASVIGKDVPLALLQAVADLSDETLRGALTRLQSAEFLYETRLFPDVEYSFKHSLTHEVTYRGSLHERRRALHARIVNAIETLHRDRLGEHVERLAYHAVQGELWPTAAAYLGQAGDKAIQRFAYRNAAASLEQAIAILATLPETREMLQQAIDLRLSLRRPMVLLAAAERGLALLDEAIHLAEKLGDTGRLGWAWAYRSAQLFTAFRRREAIAAAEHALVAAADSRDEAVELLAGTNLGVAAVELGDFSRAEEALTRVVQRTEAHLPQFDRRSMHSAGFRGTQPAVVSRGFLAICFALRGRFRDAIAYSDAALRLADSAAEPNPLVLAHIHRGRVLALQGEFGRAAEAWQRGRLIAQDHDLAMQVPGLLALQGFACARSGRSDDAASALSEATSQLEPGKPAFLNVAIELGDGLAVLGRFEDALACGRAALDAGRERGEGPLEAAAHCLLGEIAALHESAEGVSSALEHYGAARDQATAFELRPLVAHCHLGLGKLYRRTGTREQAQEHLTTATTMYREMDMRFWLEKAEAELGAG